MIIPLRRCWNRLLAITLQSHHFHLHNLRHLLLLQLSMVVFGSTNFDSAVRNPSDMASDVVNFEFSLNLIPSCRKNNTIQDILNNIPLCRSLVVKFIPISTLCDKCMYVCRISTNGSIIAPTAIILEIIIFFSLIGLISRRYMIFFIPLTGKFCLMPQLFPF